MSALENAQAKMRKNGVSELGIKVFTHYFHQLESGVTGLIPEDTIEPITDAADISTVEVSDAEAREALSKTVMLKLNGGLATSMGMEHAKSLLPVTQGKRFIDIISQQVKWARKEYGVKLPLILMNSFRTREDSLAALDENMQVDGLPLDFLQGKEPKLRVTDYEPAQWPADPSLEWCPPGHGDIYTCLQDQGLVKTLLAKGYRYLATSNADNLGSYPHPKIAGWFAKSGAPYAPEVCVRTAADRKGGHLARRISDGHVILRDTAQTPDADMHYFTDEFRHRLFHTNNLWFNLEALDQLLEEREGIAGLPLIRNQKHIDPTDSSTPEVYQLETSMGAIVEAFAGAQPILVPRERFLPVKTTNDLLTIRSDAYELGADGILRLVTQKAPLVDLDPKFFKNIADFEARFTVVPSLKDATSFTVRGDVHFTQAQSFTGDAIVEG
ncbi:UTP--glucose-1-phosphate uridylyltransferase [Arcanobacterium hippocoleae]|uniref:UTP--glucose-1-phosphate uridylyltransferase n=2 Tax=Arcanobacterium hippocoleae TaxID=149017 RepID=A0ABU1SZL2_9ACTO|nr:UTP--glucose-1-phosphate uridylyltransferase [Arcanobacterium hippocoleae]MDR6938549.1 UTP--glucose-1-phosphate uridylyltransferase [Arcanobacterium hippocoleae]